LDAGYLHAVHEALRTREHGTAERRVHSAVARNRSQNPVARACAPTGFSRRIRRRPGSALIKKGVGDSPDFGTYLATVWPLRSKGEVRRLALRAGGRFSGPGAVEPGPQSCGE